MYFISLLKQHGSRFGLSFSIIIIMLLYAANVLPLGFVQKLENYSYDARLNLMMPRTIDTRIIIIDIDEKSLKEQGRWPWGRNKLATLVDTLFEHYQVNTLGFDVIFAEKDESSGLKALELMQERLKNDAAFAKEFQAIKPTLDHDRIFADSIKNRNVVLGYYFVPKGVDSRVGQLPSPVFKAGSFGNKPIHFNEMQGYGANLPSLQQNTPFAGHLNPEPDVDGVTRSISVLYQFNGYYYDAFAIAVARAFYKESTLQAEFASFGSSKYYSGLETFNLANKVIPVDNNVAMLIPYRGPQGSFQYVSATDVLNKKVAIKDLKNKIILVGTTAPGLMDLRATPVQNIYAGVEIHANVIAGILDNNIKQRPAYTLGAQFLQLLLAGLLLALTLPYLNPLKATLMTLLTITLVLFINFASWQWANLVLPIASSLLMISLIYVVNMSYGFFVESRAKRQLADLFGQYVPPELVIEMAKNPEAINLAGESREMTVLFSDIRGFTHIAEGLNPQQLSKVMNEFLTPLTQVIHNNRGTVDKYMGDAIMAFWGAPLIDENHVQNAVNAALDMVKALELVNKKFSEKKWPIINMGVGINTGNMAVGNMGSSFRMAYTVMGDAVNLGSRLESLTKNYGVDIIVSEQVKNQTPEMLYRELDIVRVKGRDKPVTIFEPLGMSKQVSKELHNELALYKLALKLYRNKNWDLSEIQFLNLQALHPNSVLYEVYITRIKQHRRVPPSFNWDGVFNY